MERRCCGCKLSRSRTVPGSDSCLRGTVWSTLQEPRWYSPPSPSLLLLSSRVPSLPSLREDTAAYKSRRLTAFLLITVYLQLLDARGRSFVSCNSVFTVLRSSFPALITKQLTELSKAVNKQASRRLHTFSLVQSAENKQKLRIIWTRGGKTAAVFVILLLELWKKRRRN